MRRFYITCDGDEDDAPEGDYCLYADHLAQLQRYREALKKLSNVHHPSDRQGPCWCDAHETARALLAEPKETP